MNTNTNNIHNPSLLRIRVWILFVIFVNANTNMNIIRKEHSKIYSNIQIFATLWVKDGAFSHKIDYDYFFLGDSELSRASKGIIGSKGTAILLNRGGDGGFT